jgi:hypothetical protein
MPAPHTRFWLLLLLCALTLALTGCPAISDSSPIVLTTGNWSVTAISSNSAIGTVYVGGNLTQSGSDLSGTMYVVGSQCFDVSQPISFTGTVGGTNVTLVSADVNGQVFSVAATARTDSALTSGTYTIIGGCADGDNGTATANLVPSISGTWNGPITGSGGSSVTLSVALSQDAIASADGTFALTGSLVYTGSSCSVSGTILSAFVAGPYIVLNANTVETDDSTGSFSYNDVLLVDSQIPHNMRGSYQADSGLCAGDIQVLTLSKQ